METCIKKYGNPEYYTIHLYQALKTNLLQQAADSSNTIRIFVNCQGEKQFYIGEKMFFLEAGDVLFFGIGQTFKEQKTYRGEGYYIVAQPSFLLRYCTNHTNLMPWVREGDNRPGCKVTLDEEEIQALRQSIRRYDRSALTYGDDVRKTLCFIEVILRLSQAYIKRQKDREPNLQFSEFTVPAMRYIENHLEDSISLTVLAKHIGISRSYLCKVFKAGTGITVNQYILERRIALAAELLVSGKNVTEVSAEVGFHDDTYFIKAFKQMLGTTPKKYAALQRCAVS